MITPVEVLGKEIKRGFGYKAVEVDEFLEELARDYEIIYKENNELKEKVAALTENLSHYRTIEESLKKALVLAEETSKETIENASKTAKMMENEAIAKSDEMIRQAEKEAEHIRTSAQEDFQEEKAEFLQQINNYKKLIHKLESDYCSYKSRILQFINGQLDILNNPVYEMEFQVAGEQEKEQDEEYVQFGIES
ncbi:MULTISPECIES: DivIVA domain-containing protein [Anaerostipes]|uniref:DivIVA domain-containing protein n=1 Tax=Anaerostipes TaxID=207244 RepID=UPI000950E632|nr:MULTISPECIES: DivIVA domain-containing protein [Anaerostipes]MCI5623825.1 DivIVA domain-containing protein [Anaerostipes sp.]MDY2726948.1 DivIVA domain-containing protein [Anaerostipes faecalis]OLR58799.1 cell division protein DivIVA [Anaerostipes sp. 494a]